MPRLGFGIIYRRVYGRFWGTLCLRPRDFTIPRGLHESLIAIQERQAERIPIRNRQPRDHPVRIGKTAGALGGNESVFSDQQIEVRLRDLPLAFRRARQLDAPARQVERARTLVAELDEDVGDVPGTVVGDRTGPQHLGDLHISPLTRVRLAVRDPIAVADLLIRIARIGVVTTDEDDECQRKPTHQNFSRICAE